jgi:hypothetical protein
MIRRMALPYAMASAHVALDLLLKGAEGGVYNVGTGAGQADPTRDTRRMPAILGRLSSISLKSRSSLWRWSTQNHPRADAHRTPNKSAEVGPWEADRTVTDKLQVPVRVLHVGGPRWGGRGYGNTPGSNTRLSPGVGPMRSGIRMAGRHTVFLCISIGCSRRSPQARFAVGREPT